MSEFAKEITPLGLEDEMQQSYLAYAMSVIIGRALPDVRDGLKPVHRRVLYAMHELGNDWNKPYLKSARIVGDVIGKYHPHGDSAVYDALVRMAQPFSMRYMLIDGQGNFGSIDGDPPAAMRYTEVRMARISHELLADLDKDTVDFIPNYDERELEPSVLPSKVPNLLINGSSGIAVGMATNIPPHNMGEVIDAALLLIDEPETTVEQLIDVLPGPDFPTAAIINGSKGIHEAYHTGRGRIYLRARCHFEDIEDSSRQSIVVTEFPYQVNKARVMEKIAELAKEGKLTGISAIRDESDKDGIRMVVELKRGEVAEVILNNLYKHTQLQTVFGINMVAIVNNRPRCLNLKEILVAFLDFRREVVTRRTLYLLGKARDRAHVLEGLAVALANIDPIIELIKASQNSAEAKQQLIARGWKPGLVIELLERSDRDMSRPESLEPDYGLRDGGYWLSPEQAQAILDLRLHRLTGLEQEKIIEEYKDILQTIKELLEIINSDQRLLEVIREELVAVREQFSDERRAEILHDRLELSLADLISEEDVAVTISHQSYVKAQPISEYRAQRRGGRGKSAANNKEDDFVEQIIVANTHDTVLCFSNAGKVYWLKVYELPMANRNARGKPFVNLLPLVEGERINAILSVHEYLDNQFIFFATEQGTVKKTPIKEFERQRTNGKIAIDLKEGDVLVGAMVTDGQQDIMMFSSDGKAIRFAESDVRSMGRTAGGVRGMRLSEDQAVIALTHAGDDCVLSVTENGYGKRTRVDEFSPQGRGGRGVISIQTSQRNGQVVGVLMVDEIDDIMLITSGGVLVRTRASEISVIGRNTQGVKIIRLDDGEKVVSVDRTEGLPDGEDELLDDESGQEETPE
ncbi:MAG: DNA gyrase subunit A [Gammaproteobacteria bacterium]|nr:DNA gyrase subunit A [Gammaproteobacteria bacterium]